MLETWVVTYYDIGSDPIVTCFDNEDAAMKCYEHFLGKHDRVDIDKCMIFKNFLTF